MSFKSAIVDSMVRVFETKVPEYLYSEYTLNTVEGGFKLYSVDSNSGVVSFPRSAQRYFDCEDRTSQGRSIDREYEAKFKPREYQEEAVAATCQYLSRHRGGVLIAGCGKGKTVMATESALRLNKSTCILVHKEFLADQWEAAIKMLSGIHTVGRLKRDQCDTGQDFDFVIASTQSLTNPKREYPKEFFDSFGLLIADECHRYGAEIWHQVFQQFPARYRLGLTATAERYDGLWGLVQEHVGYTATCIDADPIENKVFMVKLTTGIPESAWNHKWLDDNMKRAKLVSILANHDGRNEVIARNILKAFESNRITLVISERRAQLEELSKKLQSRGVDEKHIGFFVGGRKKKDLDEVQLKPLIMCCLEEDALCLTLTGWKHYSQLSIGEWVASYSIEREVIEYVPLVDIKVYDFDGYLAEIDRKRLNVRMTWGHKNVVYRGGKEFLEKACFLQTGDKVRVFAPVDYPEHGESIGVSQAELVGWFIAEGTCTRDDGVILYQNEGKTAERIDYLLGIAGWAYSRREYRPGQISWHFGAALSRATFLNWSPDKDLNSFLIGLPQREVDALFVGLVDGDGSYYKNTVVFTQRKVSTVDWFTILALRCGYSPYVGKDERIGRVFLTKKKFVGLTDREFHVAPVKYRGKVWCPKTKNDTWIARSRGSIFITGNTYQMAKEGLDIEALDALFMATPQYGVTQTVGRILRELEGKAVPVTVDFVDSDVERLRGQAFGRVKQYRALGCEVVGEF